MQPFQRSCNSVLCSARKNTVPIQDVLAIPAVVEYKWKDDPCAFSHDSAMTRRRMMDLAPQKLLASSRRAGMYSFGFQPPIADHERLRSSVVNVSANCLLSHVETPTGHQVSPSVVVRQHAQQVSDSDRAWSLRWTPLRQQRTHHRRSQRICIDSRHNACDDGRDR